VQKTACSPALVPFPKKVTEHEEVLPARGGMGEGGDVAVTEVLPLPQKPFLFYVFRPQLTAFSYNFKSVCSIYAPYA
jgi:hypothetical protein